MFLLFIDLHYSLNIEKDGIKFENDAERFVTMSIVVITELHLKITEDFVGFLYSDRTKGS